MECPLETFGCRIQRQTESYSTILQSTYTCFDNNKTDIKTTETSDEMIEEGKIDIDIETYIGAVSVYSTGYGMGGHERAHGTISPSDWDDLKGSAKENMKLVEDSNA